MTRNLHFTPRDLAILSEFGEVGLLDTVTVRARHFPADRTGRACLRRLRRFADQGLVRPLSPLATFMEGRLPIVYCLTPRGGEVITELTGHAPQRMFSRDPRAESIPHRLGVAKLQLVVKDACRRQRFDAPRWILEHDARSGNGAGATFAERFVLYETFETDTGTISCRPDASCLLTIASASGTAHPIVIYWEFDRSSESLKQFSRKLPGYHALLSANSVAVHWPTAHEPIVCVFVVTPSKERRDHLAKLLRDRPGSEAFRFATVSDLTADAFFTAPIWYTTAGESRSILRPSIAA